MSIFNSIMNGLFDVLSLPALVSPMLALVLISAAAGIVLLILYKHTSPQKTIKKVKDRIKAGLLEIRLFKDDMGVVSGAIGRLFLRDIPSYFGCNIVPLVPLIIVVVPILVQLDARFGFAPFRTGDEFMLVVELDEDVETTSSGIGLKLPEGLAVETGPVRIPQLHQLRYNVKVEKKGDYEMVFRVRDREYIKSLAAAPNAGKISPARYKISRSKDVLFHPVESPWPSDAPLEAMTIRDYSRAGMLGIDGDSYPWLIVFCIVGLAAGLALKGVFKVTI